MKKFIFIIFMIVFMAGCSTLMNTPTKKVEYLLSKYQKNDEEVLKQLNDTLLNDTILEENQRERYENIMKKQYRNLTYKVKNEAIDGKTAIVEVEIEVYNYAKAITDIENNLLENSDLYKDNTGEINTIMYNDDKLTALENIKDRVKYTINFTLSKIDEEWVVDDLTEMERLKIHGLYNY